MKIRNALEKLKENAGIIIVFTPMVSVIGIAVLILLRILKIHIEF